MFFFRIKVPVYDSDRKFLVFKLISHNRYSFENIPIHINKHTVTVQYKVNFSCNCTVINKIKEFKNSSWFTGINTTIYSEIKGYINER